MAWWHEAVFYQIYPRSFLDTNGDGVGDLGGIRAQMPYIKSLGVDALWITPIYPSPQRDFSYDISEYCDVDPLFGSLEEFDLLIGEAHAADLRVILDWVPNHTSSDHPWFQESRATKDNPKRDWYIWKEPNADGSLPNNWLRSWSDETAWTLDDATNQYFLHCFLPEQPDLNWANVAVRDAMKDTLRFWLNRGVDGFRMDVIHLLGKDPTFPDDPEDLVAIGHVPLNDVPVTHQYLREIRSVLDQYDDKVSVGEVYLLDPEAVARYYGTNDELHLSFNFASIFTPWRADAWLNTIQRTEDSHNAVNAWPTWTLSNHDNQRIATRLRNDPVRIRSAMVMLLTLRGTPFLYAGEELGLPDAEIDPDQVVDPGLRDGCRSPLPWLDAPLHGWPTTPWLPFVARAQILAVQTQEADANSMLHFTRQLLAIRKGHSALRHGDLTKVSVDSDVLTYERSDDSERIVVAVNFSRTPQTLRLSDGDVILTSSGDAESHNGVVTIGAGGCVVTRAHQKDNL